MASIEDYYTVCHCVLVFLIQTTKPSPQTQSPHAIFGFCGISPGGRSIWGATLFGFSGRKTREFFPISLKKIPKILVCGAIGKKQILSSGAWRGVTLFGLCGIWLGGRSIWRGGGTPKGKRDENCRKCHYNQ